MLPRSLHCEPQRARLSGRDDKVVEGAQRDSLLIVSGCAPGARFIVERRYRDGFSDVPPLPGQIEFEGTACGLRSLWLNPALSKLPEIQKGSGNGREIASFRKKEMLSDRR